MKGQLTIGLRNPLRHSLHPFVFFLREFQYGVNESAILLTRVDANFGNFALSACFTVQIHDVRVPDFVLSPAATLRIGGT